MDDAYLNKLLGENEKIILVTRRHWFVLVEHILAEIIISSVVILLVLLVGYFANIGFLAFWGLLFLFIPLVSLLRDVFIWNNHKYVVTNLRVIQVMGIFNKNVIDSSLEKVNDVRLTQSFIGRLFNFGDVEVLTASELGVNRFTRIGEPVKFKTAMLNAKVRLEEQHGTMHVDSAQDDVPALISRLGDLRDRGLVTEQEFQEKKAKLLAKL
jgi:uncharacterized membrane protein YdbT with pleckstrin-like domain